MYLNFLAGAVLCRAYNEPFIRAETHGPPGFLSRAKQSLEHTDRTNNSRGLFTDDDIQYVLSYPVYNFESHKAQDPYFHDFAELFVHESRLQLQEEGPITNPPRPDPRPAPKLDKLDPLQNIILHKVGMFAVSWPLEAFLGKDFPANVDRTKPVRKVSVIPLRAFWLTQITMPSTMEPVNPSMEFFGVITPYGQYTRSLMDLMHESSGQINHYDFGCPSAHPPSQLVQHILRKYLNLRFVDKTFRVAVGESHIPETFGPRWPQEDAFEYADVPPRNPHYACLKIT
jgi:hypothetical protein